jgi:alpha-L-rhamnosidase
MESDNTWNAQWISAFDGSEKYDTTTAAPYFRKEFKIRQPVKSAIAKVTGVGYFEFYLNGKKVGNHQLDPAFTRYDKRVKYLVFDVHKYLQHGRNAAGGILGNGFYNVDTKSAWDFNTAPWRSFPAFICQIDIEYENGRSGVIVTDDSWKFNTGPILFDQIRNGEIYDANRELTGWSEAGFNDSDWERAYVGNGPLGMLSEQVMPPIRKTKILRPVTIIEPKSGTFIVDFGYNISGWAKIRIREEKGKEIVMRYGERIFEDGSLDVKELSRFIFTGETQTTRYISNGKESQEYEPRFTYFGFQYVEVTGISDKLDPGDIEAYMINTDFEEAGYFECSNSLFNQIHENIKWSYLGNYHGYPEDCPHREKMAWTGDGQLVVETGLFNFNAVSAYIKWMEDHLDEQKPSGDLPGIIPTSGWGYFHGKNPDTSPYGYGPHWEGSAVVIPWHLYRHTGDTLILKRFYPMMKKYVTHLENISDKHLLNFGIDDHKSIVTHTEGGYISSAYFCWFSDILENAAGILDFPDDVIKYSNLKKNIASSFHKKNFNPESHTYGNGGQTQMALALACGIVPEDIERKVFDNLLEEIKRRDYHFDCGVVGLRKVIDVLLKYDRKDILYKMANQKDFPSFGHWIEQGANTMWQNWDGSQSRNHIMFGSIGDYFYYGLGGIKPSEDAPGFKKIILTPQFPDDMTYLKCGHNTPFGWIRTDWKKVGNEIYYQLSIPDSMITELTIPQKLSNIKCHDDTIENTAGVEIIEQKTESVKLLISPGQYKFQIKIK